MEFQELQRVHRLFQVLACACVPLMSWGCASQSGHFEARLLFQHERLAPEELSDQTLCILPLIRKTGFDSTPAISARILGAVLWKSRKDFKVSFKEDFEQRFLENHTRDSLKVFYKNLFEGNILALQTSDSVWQCMPCRYALAMRLKDAGRVKNFDGVTKRNIWLEAEIWSTTTAEVVWRAATTGFDADVDSRDSDFILEGVAKIYEMLPAYHPALHDEEW